MQILQEITNRKRLSILSEIPLTINYLHGKPTEAQFSDGTNCSLACIGCINPKCMYFDKSDVCCDIIDGFPNDQSLNVCPTEAIVWNSETDTPIIDTNKCFNCGICISRCPVGALYFDGGIKVNRFISSKQKNYRVDSDSEAAHIGQIKILSKIKTNGVAIMESDELLESIYDKLSRIDSDYHNIIGRNMLISLGAKSSTRRIGDVYTRMDAVYSSDAGTFGTVEIEFGQDTLDACRGVLDDIAVLFARYGVAKLHNMALVICLKLPNARQGYWQVVKDIMSVERIKIGTTTIGALMLLLWNGCSFAPENDSYYVDYDNMSIHNVITKQIGRKLNLSDKLLGILEPMK